MVYKRKPKKPYKKPLRKKTIFKAKKQKFVGRKVELLSIRTMKPVKNLKRFTYTNKYLVTNALSTSGSNQQPQFITLNLNSPWVAGTDTYAQYDSCTWEANKPHIKHAGTNLPSYGSQYDMLYDQQGAIGYSYQDATICGTKVSLRCTPQFSTSICGPTTFFAIMTSQVGSTITNAISQNTLSQMPYTTNRRIEGNQSGLGLNGNSKSSSITIKYSPKKFNGLTDLMDNNEMTAHITVPDFTTSSGTAPQEKDFLTFGILNTIVNPSTPRPCTPVLIEVKMEALIMFREPFNNNNIGSNLVPNSAA